MLASHFLSGEKKVGYMTKTHEDGFNGIAVTIWDAGFQKRMKDR